MRRMGGWHMGSGGSGVDQNGVGVWHQRQCALRLGALRGAGQGEGLTPAGRC